MDFHLASYKKHANSLHPTELADTWKRFDTVDYWRHERMYNNILPVLQAYPESSWLTVGDGRYGTDANFLMRQGADVLATDINDTLLIKAQTEADMAPFQMNRALVKASPLAGVMTLPPIAFSSASRSLAEIALGAPLEQPSRPIVDSATAPIAKPEKSRRVMPSSC